MRISLETLLRMSLLLSSLLTGVMNCKLATAYEIAPSYRFKLKTPKLTPSQRRQAREDGENRFVQEQTSRAFVDQFTEARRQTRDALVAAYHAGEELAQTRSNAEHRMRVLVGAQDHHDDPTLFAGQPWEAALDLLSEGTVGDRLWLLEKFHATEGHSEKLDRRELAYLSARNLTPFDVQFGFPEMTARDFIGHVTHEEQALEALSELVAIPQSWLVASLYTHLRDIPLFRESREAGNTPPHNRKWRIAGCDQCGCPECPGAICGQFQCHRACHQCL